MSSKGWIDPRLKRDEDKWWRLSSQLEAVERRHRILRLIRDGATAEEVSELLAQARPPVKITPNSIRALVKRYLNEVHRDDALSIEQMKGLENERLTDMEKRLKARLIDKEGEINLKVVDRLIRLSERRAKLNGLDAAQKVEHYVGRGLEALGLSEEHIRNAEEAFNTAFTRERIPDVQVVEEEPLALPEGGEGAEDDPTAG